MSNISLNNYCLTPSPKWETAAATTCLIGNFQKYFQFQWQMSTSSSCYCFLQFGTKSANCQLVLLTLSVCGAMKFCEQYSRSYYNPPSTSPPKMKITRYDAVNFCQVGQMLLLLLLYKLFSSTLMKIIFHFR